MAEHQRQDKSDGDPAVAMGRDEILFYCLIMIYKVTPSRHTRFSEVWLGALIVTVVLWPGQQLFLVYATNLANFDALYSALGGIVAFLLWLYLSSCVGVAGICFCAARAEGRGRIDSHSEKPRER